MKRAFVDANVILRYLTRDPPEMAEEIAPTLIQFLHADGLEVESLDLLTEALALYHEQNLDFAGALVATVARRKGPPTVYSFDHDFDRVAGLTRLTPG